MEFVLVRHTVVDLPQGVCYGQTDVSLRESFADEAAVVARALRQHAPFDAVYTSPLSRCTRLAEACGYGEARRDARLMELNFGAWEMRRWEEFPREQAERWYADWINTPTPGGESFGDQLLRVEAFLHEAAAQPACERVLLFTHGGVIACAGVLLGGAQAADAFRNPVPNGAIITYTYPRATSR